MEISTAERDGVTIISLAGNLDGSAAPQAQERISAAIAADGCRLVLDLGKCPYISSAGLRVLLSIAKQLPAKKGRWAFAGLSEEVRDVMDMTGFSGFFSLYATVEEALNSVKEARH